MTQRFEQGARGSGLEMGKGLGARDGQGLGYDQGFTMISMPLGHSINALEISK